MSYTLPPIIDDEHVSETTASPKLHFYYHVLRSSPLFSSIEESTIKKMLSVMRKESWDRGRCINYSHDTQPRFFILINGRAKVVSQHHENGRELTFFLLGPGDGSNILSLFYGRRYTVHTFALDDVATLSASVTQWQAWRDYYPSVNRAIERLAAEHIQWLSELATSIALDDTMTRLVKLLLRYMNDDHVFPRMSLVKDLSQEELAHMIGTTRPVIARLLGELKRDGILATNNGTLEVVNGERLMEKLHTPYDANAHPTFFSGQ